MMTSSQRMLLTAVCLALGLVAPLLLYPVFVMKLMCFALFACAFNLLVGYTGLMAFGHAAFFGVGAYATGHAMKAWQLTPELGLLFGMSMAMLLGVAVGALAIRRQGIYFSMTTLALAQMVYFLCLQAKFTGGEDGLQGVPRGHLFGIIPLQSDLVLYYVVLGVCTVGFGLIYRAIHSPFGRVLVSIRENERRAISLGYNVDRFKLIAFVLSAALAGLAGAVKTLVFGFASLTDVHWHTSGEVILMTLVGGMGTVFGPAVGAVLVVTLQNELADKVGSKVTMILGFTFMACVLLFRKGIVGTFEDLRNRRARALPAPVVGTLVGRPAE